MSFSSDVKNEICRLRPENICCARAELAGIFCFAAQIKKQSIKIKTENEAVAKRVNDLTLHLYKLSMDINFRKSGLFSAEMDNVEVIKILRDLRLSSIPIRIDKNIVRSECCKRAFIRGAFLGSGSVSAPVKSYHAEFVTSHYAICADFTEILSFFNITPKVINRNGNYVFYIKDSNHIEDLLVILGAHTQMMNFLNVKIEKEVRNHTNRRVNCENANSEKRAGAAVEQTHAILLLHKKIGLENLPARLAQVAEIRLDNPEATLSDIAAQLGITKSGVNHRMRKLMQLAREVEND